MIRADRRSVVGPRATLARPTRGVPARPRDPLRDSLRATPRRPASRAGLTVEEDKRGSSAANSTGQRYSSTRCSTDGVALSSACGRALGATAPSAARRQRAAPEMGRPNPYAADLVSIVVVGNRPPRRTAPAPGPRPRRARDLQVARQGELPLTETPPKPNPACLLRSVVAARSGMLTLDDSSNCPPCHPSSFSPLAQSRCCASSCSAWSRCSMRGPSGSSLGASQRSSPSPWTPTWPATTGR